MIEIAAAAVAAVASLAPVELPSVPLPIVADCSRPQALEQALTRAAKQGGGDIRVEGSCTGNYRIETDSVTLRGAPGASLIAADPDAPVVEVVAARAALRNLTVRGGVVGLYVHGTDHDVLLVGLTLRDNIEGAFADDRARMRVIDTVVEDCRFGLSYRDADGNVSDSTIAADEVGISILSDARFALIDSVVRDHAGAGISVGGRSDALLIRSHFENNGQVHVNAIDYSTVSLLQETTLGVSGDETWFALGSGRRSTVSATTAGDVYGDVSSLSRASINLFNGVVHGDLLVQTFSDAHVINVEVTGQFICTGLSQALCSGVTSGGNFGCASECGDATAQASTRGALDFALPTPPRDYVAR